MHDVLVSEIGCVNERAGRTIELPQNTELAHFEKGLAPADVDQNIFEDFVHVLRLSWKVLVVPLHFSGIGIEREGRVRIERVPVGAASRSGPRFGLGRAPINEVRLGIVAARDPGIAAGAVRQWQVAPCVPAGLARAGDR